VDGLHGEAGRMTMAAAAAAMGVARSTVTRWCQKHPALLGDDGLVDLEQLRGHRDQVIDPRLQTRTSGEATEAATAPARPADAPRRHRAAPPPSSLNDHRARREAAAADEAELNLAERMGETISRRAVVDAVMEAGQYAQQAVGQIARDRAERIARIVTVREAERAIEDALHALLRVQAEALAAAVRERAGAAQGPEAAPQNEGASEAVA
jgi:hypothetical protein